MQSKLENTLIIIFNILFFISFNSYSKDFSPEVAACNRALDQANPSQALDIAEQMLKQAQQSEDALLCKGRALGALGQNEEAEKALLLSVQYAKSGFETTIANLVLGNFYKSHDNFVSALACYQKSLQASERESNQKFMRISHNQIGAVFTQQKDYQAALHNYDEGAKLAMNDNERADSYERLATAYQSMHMLDKAIEYQLKGTLMQKKSGTLDQYAEASLVLGQLFAENKDYPSAEKTYERLLQFSKDNGGEYYAAKTEIYLAQTKLAQGDQVTANTLLQEASVIADKIQANDLNLLIKNIKK
ncbi:MAG TPA: hypothetical protein DCO68_10930 [Methylophilaceae bacterium]|nr:hypothetical protein [Methylophilaceae bacterium]